MKLCRYLSSKNMIITIFIVLSTLACPSRAATTAPNTTTNATTTQAATTTTIQPSTTTTIPPTTTLAPNEPRTVISVGDTGKFGHCPLIAPRVFT